ncbi:expressed protein, partial [Dictyostelium purpureum]
MDILFSLNKIGYGNYVKNNKILKFDELIVSASKQQNFQIIKYLFKYNKFSINYNKNEKLLIPSSINGNMEIWNYLTDFGLKNNYFKNSLDDLLNPELLINLSVNGQIEMLNTILSKYKIIIQYDNDLKTNNILQPNEIIILARDYEKIIEGSI